MKCNKCGKGAIEVSERGVYLRRVNAFGVKGVWECTPTCDHLHGDQNDALIGALEDKQLTEEELLELESQLTTVQNPFLSSPHLSYDEATEKYNTLVSNFTSGNK